MLFRNERVSVDATDQTAISSRVSLKRCVSLVRRKSLTSCEIVAWRDLSTSNASPKAYLDVVEIYSAQDAGQDSVASQLEGSPWRNGTLPTQILRVSKDPG